MFSQIKISAILVGTFILVLGSIAALLATIVAYKWTHSNDNPTASAIYLLVLFLVRLTSFFAAGYMSAKIAKNQPLLHGFICGILGLVFTTLFGGNLFLGLFFVLPSVFAGAWYQKNKHLVI